jgi:hypothetical protein
MKGCKPLNLLCWPLPLYSCALGAEVLLLKYLCNTKYLRIIISHKYLILTRKTHPVRNSNRLCVPEEDVMTIVPLFYFRASWAGGERGLTLTRQLLAQLPNLLTKKGFALVSWTMPTFANHVYCFHPMVFMCGGGCLGKAISLELLFQYYGALHLSSTILQYLAVQLLCLPYKSRAIGSFKSSFKRPGTDTFNCTVY